MLGRPRVGWRSEGHVWRGWGGTWTQPQATKGGVWPLEGDEPAALLGDFQPPRPLPLLPTEGCVKKEEGPTLRPLTHTRHPCPSSRIRIHRAPGGGTLASIFMDSMLVSFCSLPVEREEQRDQFVGRQNYWSGSQAPPCAWGPCQSVDQAWRLAIWLRARFVLTLPRPLPTYPQDATWVSGVLGCPQKSHTCHPPLPQAVHQLSQLPLCTRPGTLGDRRQPPRARAPRAIKQLHSLYLVLFVLASPVLWWGPVPPLPWAWSGP